MFSDKKKKKKWATSLLVRHLKSGKKGNKTKQKQIGKAKCERKRTEKLGYEACFSRLLEEAKGLSLEANLFCFLDV